MPTVHETMILISYEHKGELFLFIVNILWIFLFNTRPECYDIIKCLRNCCGLSYMLLSSTQATMNAFDECDLFDKAVQLSVYCT